MLVRNLRKEKEGQEEGGGTMGKRRSEQRARAGREREKEVGLGKRGGK